MDLWTKSRFSRRLAIITPRLANLGVQFLALLKRNNAHAAALVTARGGASKGSNMCAAR